MEGKIFSERIREMQDNVINAAGLVSVLAEAAFFSEPAAGSIGCSLNVLYEYLRRTEDGIEEMLEETGQGKEAQE